MKLKHGLKPADILYIVKVIQGFGSRAKGTHHAGSDVDLAVYGEEITIDTLSSLHARLEDEGPLPYLFDIVNYTNLQHKELKEHIDRVGTVICG